MDVSESEEDNNCNKREEDETSCDSEFVPDSADE